MMPTSSRIAPSYDAPAAQPTTGRTKPVRAAKSGTLVIAVATTFALLSALVSLLPDAAARPKDDLALAPLRGSLPAVDEMSR